MSQKKAARIINVLSDRGGFDGWWDSIDARTQQEILDEIETELQAMED